MKKQKDILDIYKELYKKDQTMNKFFDSEVYFLDPNLDSIANYILDIYDIPKDNPAGLSIDEFTDKTFCRDRFFDSLWDFVDDEITKKECIKHFEDYQNNGVFPNCDYE